MWRRKLKYVPSCSLFSSFLLFSIAELRAILLGPSDLYVKLGSDINLVCKISKGPHDLGTVFWYKGNASSPYITVACIQTYITKAQQRAQQSLSFLLSLSLPFSLFHSFTLDFWFLLPFRLWTLSVSFGVLFSSSPHIYKSVDGQQRAEMPLNCR